LLISVPLSKRALHHEVLSPVLVCQITLENCVEAKARYEKNCIKPMMKCVPPNPRTKREE
jgi:hypothetical protein